jgi:hypothetical protein
MQPTASPARPARFSLCWLCFLVTAVVVGVFLAVTNKVATDVRSCEAGIRDGDGASCGRWHGSVLCMRLESNASAIFSMVQPHIRPRAHSGVVEVVGPAPSWFCPPDTSPLNLKRHRHFMLDIWFRDPAWLGGEKRVLYDRDAVCLQHLLAVRDSLVPTWCVESSSQVVL